MVISKHNYPKITQQLTQALDQALSKQELDTCLAQMNIFEPATGEFFWRSKDDFKGIYVIIAGKVRLIGRDGNLITSLSPGESFGELNLFGEENFQPYGAKAGLKLKLAHVKLPCLRFLIEKYPQIKQHLHHQAVQRDLLIICHRIPGLGDSHRQGLKKLVSRLQEHHLPLGKLPNSVRQNQQLWLLRQGELHHNSGQKCIPGYLYPLSQLPESGTWQVTQSTKLYSLGCFNGKTLDNQWLELKDLLGLNSPQTPEPKINPSVTPSPPRSQRQVSKISQAYFPSPTLKVSQWWQYLTQHYPFFEQQSDSDCGVACLVMISRYWGKRFNVNQLRQIANVNREGSSLRGLITAAESIGFSPQAVKTDLPHLAKQNLPAIVHWQGNHYIVVYKITPKKVIVADPKIGRRILPWREFRANWTGYTLLLQPTALFEQIPEAQNNLWKFFELLKPHRLVVIEILIASIMIQIFGLITPLFTQLLLDRVVVQHSSVSLIAIGLGLLIFGTFRVIMASLRQYLLFHTANRIELALVVGLINHTFRLPISYFNTRYVGDITSRIQENEKISRFLTGEALTTILDLLTVFIYVGLMLVYSWQMALITLGSITLLVILALVATPFLKRISREIFNAQAVEESYLIEALTGIETVKAMGTGRTVRWRWEELFNKSIEANLSGELISEKLSFATAMVGTYTSSGLLILGIWLVIQNQLTIGQLIAFNMLLGNVLTPFGRLIDLWDDFQEVVISVERIHDIIEVAPEEDNLSSPRPSLPQITGEIRFEQVSFRYNSNSETNVLENLSFTIQPAQTVALVGRSGSGKTTVAKLILGLYQPTRGKIFLDGYELSRISFDSWRQQVGVVDQNTFMFGGTIRENLTIAYPRATQREIEGACELAGARQFIEELPLQYETHIGEGGSMLSGGQRQRLAIARALLGNPRLLILDEATSSLDTESERIIQNNLNAILKKQTTLVIAHRLSTVRNADLILVLDRGVLVEQGTHEELMAQGGQYFYLNQQQLP